jgi:hypothetical protein
MPWRLPPPPPPPPRGRGPVGLVGAKPTGAIRGEPNVSPPSAAFVMPAASRAFLIASRVATAILALAVVRWQLNGFGTALPNPGAVMALALMLMVAAHALTGAADAALDWVAVAARRRLELSPPPAGGVSDPEVDARWEARP